MKTVDNIIDDNQYYKTAQAKNQIVIHHTAGGPVAANVIHGWNFNPERIGTAYVIDSFGIVYKAFEPQYWAHHLGTKSAKNVALNKASIGIEVCSWGQLILKDEKYYNYINKVVPENEVIQISKFRGFEYYHKYNDLQLASLKTLILQLSKMFNIDLKYNFDMWDISKDALAGKNGIYTHVSFRKDKTDMSPQPKLVNMLTSLIQPNVV